MAANFAPLLNFEPIAALILGSIFLDQLVTTVQVVGAGIVISALVFMATAPNQVKPKAIPKR
jgi:threonine/homoserine efflux transporter RhtA